MAVAQSISAIQSAGRHQGVSGSITASINRLATSIGGNGEPPRVQPSNRVASRRDEDGHAVADA
jgi:hypothetical protein